MSTSNDNIIILDLKELAEKLKVSTKMLKTAIDTGQFKAGVHYMLIGTEPRFHWCQKLIEKIHSTCAAVTEKKNMGQEARNRDMPKKPAIIGRSSFDYSCLP